MSVLSGYITYFGYAVLTYKTCQSFSNSKKIQELLKDDGLLTEEEREEKQNQIYSIDILKRWLVFIAFLFLEPFFFALAELVPFGQIFVLFTKILIIYPHVLVHSYLYELLDKLELDNYAEKNLFSYISTFLKESIIFTLNQICVVVKYVNIHELKEIEDHINKVNQKIGFKYEVLEKRDSLLQNQGKDHARSYKSAIQFRQSVL